VAFDFLGTFNKSQYNRFATFAKDQLLTFGPRVAHNVSEVNRLGSLTFEYDSGGRPIKFTSSDVTSTYIGRLVAAYEVLGGDVQYDLQVRSLTQAVYLMPASETAPPQLMSNGEIVGQKGLADALTAELMRSARSHLTSALHYKREYLERKVRRSLDYADQLTAETALMSALAASAEAPRSLGSIFQAIEDLLTDQNYRPIYDDKGLDPYGKLTYAPFAPYSTADAKPENLPTETGGYQRDIDGARVPGITSQT